MAPDFVSCSFFFDPDFRKTQAVVMAALLPAPPANSHVVIVAAHMGHIFMRPYIRRAFSTIGKVGFVLPIAGFFPKALGVPWG